jgi:thioredoxin-like negative regulator of GroEL
MAAKEKWLGGDIPGAQAILAEAFKQNEDSESIFLAAAKLASETNEMEAAQQILEKARSQADTERVSLHIEVGDQADFVDLDEICTAGTTARQTRRSAQDT